MAVEPLIDPTGNGDLTSNTTLAPRPGTLRGRTLGLLNNTKPNAAVLLQELGEQLQRGYGLREFVIYTKPYFGTPVEQTQIERIVQECDFAVAAVGD
ncbi:hypothetical protein H4W31_005408 [Plantactinospora soyae]|uniref:UGSC-like domain-containing protein n=1 Tax=Plantactinospora soyae TaxID=1544732 RepID=A0A927MA43_9ACTN|nr:hypothetical protein [Plantactinospora soyae]MBE1489770.1 hypothetical protein [Plantactinospora soyae]